MQIKEKKTLCFIGNFYKTEVYRCVAKLLEEKGVEVFWIIPNTTQYSKYVKEYGEEKVLLIDRTIVNDKYAAVADLKINEILYGDRIWKYDLDGGTRYLVSLQNVVKEYITKNHIQTVFGENTTAEELLICRLCHHIKELNCNYYSMMTTRIPGNRFHFFEDEKQVYVFKRKGYEAKEHIDLQVKKPSYALLNDKLIKKSMSVNGVMGRLKRFITGENIEQTDPDVLTNKKTRFLVKSTEVKNQQLYRNVKRQELSFIEGKKYAFYGFHKQPESSIDVCGRYMEDQLQVVKNIWRQLPPDWYLVIKEHSNAIGDRSPKFFKELSQFPNIILLKENIDSKFIIGKAQLVITNTGTMGLEAALMGIPAITLSRVVFNCLNYCQYFNWQRFEDFSGLVAITEYIKSLPDNKEDYRDLVKHHSFLGYIGDTYGTPEILNDVENNKNLAEAFYELVNRYEC